MKSKYGFTLIESVIVIVVMGLAMVTIVSFLSPQIARSGDPHYDTRAAALGQSVMTQILARKFDENSGEQGGIPRCSSSDLGYKPCTSEESFGIDLGESNEMPENYNDVDDFIGCWKPGASDECRDLNLLVGNPSYMNFSLEVSVKYALLNDVSLKKIELTISASNHQPITLIGFRGNY